MLDVFRTTGKIYEATAARIFGVPFDSIVKATQTTSTASAVKWQRWLWATRVVWAL